MAVDKKTEKKNRLGRGIHSLLGGSDVDFNQQEGWDEKYPIDQLETNPEQPRRTFEREALEELAQSIHTHGLLQPLLVRREGNRAIIVAGERRYRASKLAGLQQVPVRFIEADEQKTREMALVENLQREDLAPLELSQALKELVERFGLTQDELSQRLGWSRSAVTNKLRLLALTEEARQALEEGLISEGHGRALLGLDTEEQMNRALGETLRLSWSVRQLENRVKNMKEQSLADTLPRPKSWRPRSAARLAKQLNIGVSISGLEENNSLSLRGLSRWQVQRICYLLEQDLQDLSDRHEGS